MGKGYIFASLIVLASVSFIVVGCDDWDVKAPEATQAGQPAITVADSAVRIPISVRTSDISTAVLKKERGTPLFKGRTDEISARLLVDESISAILEDVIVTPYKAGGCAVKNVVKSCPKQTVERIKDSCFSGFPPKIFDCFKNITKTIYVPCSEQVRECWPEIKAVVESRVKSAAYIKETLLPTSIWLNYQGWLHDLQLTASGSGGLKIGVRMQADVSADLKQGILRASHTVKGLLKCSSDFEIYAEGIFALSPDATADLKITALDIDTEKLCVPGAIELLNLQLLQLGLYLPKELLEDALEPVLLETVNNAIQKELGEDLDFRQRLDTISQKLQQPINLADNVWLAIHPHQIMVSPPRGEGNGADNVLRLDAGMIARPVVTLGTQPQPDKSPMTLIITDNLPDGISLVANGKVSLDQASDIVGNAARSFLDENHSDKPVTAGEIELYQSGEKLVIAIEIIKRSEKQALGRIFLWAEPYLDINTDTVRLRAIDFDVETKNMLVKTAQWLLDSNIRTALEEKSVFEYSGTLSQINRDLKTIEVTSQSGKLTASFDAIKPKAVWISDYALNVLAEVRGGGAFQVTPNF